MRSTPFKLFAVAAALSLAGAALGNSPRDSKQKALAEVAGYKSWARVTPEPVQSDSFLAGG